MPVIKSRPRPPIQMTITKLPVGQLYFRKQSQMRKNKLQMNLLERLSFLWRFYELECFTLGHLASQDYFKTRKEAPSHTGMMVPPCIFRHQDIKVGANTQHPNSIWWCQMAGSSLGCATSFCKWRSSSTGKITMKHSIHCSRSFSRLQMLIFSNRRVYSKHQQLQ